MVPRGQPLPHHASLAGPQLELSPCSVRVKAAMSPGWSADGLEETEGGSALAAAPLCPLAGPQLPPARSAPRLQCPLAGPPKTQSSIVGLKETEGDYASATALDGNRALLVGCSTPFASSTMMSFTQRRASISPKQQRDVALKAHVASIHFKCFRGILQMF